MVIALVWLKYDTNVKVIYGEKRERRAAPFSPHTSLRHPHPLTETAEWITHNNLFIISNHLGRNSIQ